MNLSPRDSAVPDVLAAPVTQDDDFICATRTMKISVVIPAHNAQLYVADAIESCLNQTCPPHEVIVVDDASTDDTARVAESYSPAVRVIRLTKNLGAAGARNRGVQESTGDWIALLDADDLFLTNKLELQTRCAEQNPDARIIYTGFRASKAGEEGDGYSAPAEELSWKLRYRCPICLSTAMVRRDFFNELGGFDPSVRFIEDYEFWLRAVGLHSASVFAMVPQPCAIYRGVPGSVSSSWIRMFRGREAIVESRNLYGLRGIARIYWRRVIRSFNYFEAALALREEGYQDYLRYMIKSLLLWPFPGTVLPWFRYKAAVVMVKQSIVSGVTSGSPQRQQNPLREDPLSVTFARDRTT